ncbi:MAG: hypothetical protein B6D73_10720 [gamma proteobacterium symbiont of Stewartia floridana]|nr:MAG: hypothetical protein B6D73_10720 [gamma proteobacterium symbiont of Stewartia floridana]
MRIEKGEERSEIDIPLSEVIGEGGKLNILPDVKKYFSIDYKPRNDKLTLVAGGYIGLIPINDDLAVEITPRFPISNLTRIVSIAEDKFNTLDFFARKYKEVDTATPVVFEFMAECLANELKELESEGVLKEYLRRNEDSHKIKGRIDINGSIKHLWSHGHFNKAHISFFDFTPDNPFNQLIKYAINYCIIELHAIQSEKAKLRKELIEFYSYFDGVSLYHDRRFEKDVYDSLESDKISDLRKYYANVCEICRLIINNAGISFDESGHDVDMSTFTLDMAAAFEKYLLNSLRLNRSTFPADTAILDGNKEGKKKFYRQPSLAKGDAKPDLIIKIDDQFKIIADAKYKPGSKDNDRYQVISHALSYGSNIAVLILPRTPSSPATPLINLGTVGEGYRVDVYEYYYDLAETNLEEEEQRFASSLASLAHPH